MYGCVSFIGTTSILFFCINSKNVWFHCKNYGLDFFLTSCVVLAKFIHLAVIPGGLPYMACFFAWRSPCLRLLWRQGLRSYATGVRGCNQPNTCFFWGMFVCARVLNFGFFWIFLYFFSDGISSSARRVVDMENWIFWTSFRPVIQLINIASLRSHFRQE